jgi:hypothetical protein
MKIITLSGGRCDDNGCSKETGRKEGPSKETGRKEGPSKKTRRKEDSPQEEIIFGFIFLFSLYFFRICEDFAS